MTTIQGQHHSSAANLMIPKGIIVGLDDAVAIPPGFVQFTDADNHYLKGTVDDALLGTKTQKPDIIFNTVGGGSHVSAGNKTHAFVLGYGWWTDNSGSWGSDGSPGPYQPRRRNAGYVFNHAHQFSLDYSPPKSRIRLIKADNILSEATDDIIMFGDGQDNGEHTPFDEFNQNPDGILYAADRTTYLHAGIVGSVSPGGSNHHHWSSHSTRAYYNAPHQGYTSVGSAGANHSHGINTLNVTPNFSEAVLKAFKILRNHELTGMIGMCADPVIPWGWEVVAYLDDLFIRFADSNFSHIKRANTISVSGSTASWAHSHGFSGSGTGYGCWIEHRVGHRHSHSISADLLPYDPKSYSLKFVRCII